MIRVLFLTLINSKTSSKLFSIKQIQRTLNYKVIIHHKLVMFFWGQIVSLCLSESADSNVMVEQTQEINFIPTMEGKSNKIKTVKPSYSGYKVHYTPYQKAFIFG